MRVKNFFLSAQTHTGAGTLPSFGVTGSDPSIGATNVTVGLALAKHETSDCDFNLFVSDSTVSDGSVAMQFSKSALNETAADSIDTFILSARG